MKYHDKYKEKYKFENDYKYKYKFIHRSNFFFLILKRYNHDINKIMNYMQGNKQIHKFIKLIHNKQKIKLNYKEKKPFNYRLNLFFNKSRRKKSKS